MAMEVNTSAPDMFPPLHTRYSGTLMHNAQARTRPSDREGHMVPVICFDIEVDGTTHNVAHVEQPFIHGTQEQAEAAARRLKKGMHVSCDHPATGLRVTLPNTLHVHVLSPSEETA
jgi:hypothetical protein